MAHRLYSYLLLFSLVILCFDLTSSEVSEANDTVRCQNQHFILPRNDAVTIQTYENETCDFVVSSANDQGITVNVLWLSSRSILDYFVLQESGAECFNRSFAWIGFTTAEPCAIVLYCSIVHISVRVSSILEIQESSMIASTNNFEYIKGFDTSNLSAFENSEFQQCENVHIVDEIYQVPHYDLPYVRLQELNPSLKITLEGDPYFKPDELPGFDLDLPDAILLAEFPERPNGCFCTLRFQVYFVDCPDVYVSKNILIVSGHPALILSNSTAIDVSDRQLTHIEPQCFLNRSDVIILLLSQNKISTIGPGIFEGLENIHTVDLSSNQISSIEAGSFSHLYKLKRLLLNVNKLKYISHSWLDGLVNLQVLYLGGNTIKEVESDIFLQMQSLNVLSLPNCYLAELWNLPNELLLLDIAANNFSSIPTNLPKNLTHLSLDKNNLSSLNQTILYDKSTMISLVLSYNNISKIASDLFSDLYTLKRLYLDFNTLEKIQIDLFDNLSKLELLALSNNSIVSLPLGVFRDCHQLKELWLNNNKLNVIQIDLFDELKKLEILSLSSNNIESLQSDVFRDLQQLRELYVNENKLNVIQRDLFNSLTKLETLNLRKNHFESLPSGVFRDLHQLRKLHLYKNKLSMIQSDLFNNLTNLEILSLNENTIESLPSGVFRDLYQLRLLTLYENKFNVIQNELFNGLTKLETLSLSNNNIESLPSGIFGDLHQLRELYLYDNKLNMIQSDLFNGLTKLEILSLGNNSLESLPSGVFRDLYQLRGLFLYDNKVKGIQIDLFNELRKLEILQMRNNNIELVPSGIFKDLQQLQELSLHGNKLKVIQSDIFSGLTKLEKLNLNNNEIESLPSTLFKDLKSLKGLHLYNNRLTEIPEDIFHQFNGMPLQILTIYSNKIIRLYPYQFANLTDLIVLDLMHNELRHIHSKALSGLTKLKYLDLGYNNLSKITKNSFMGLSLENNSYIRVDSPPTCCFLETRSQSQCVPRNEKSPYFTCKQLLPSTAVKCCAWIFGFCALFANIVVFIWGCEKIKSKSAEEKPVKQIIFITNLALADLLMGVYLLVIASVDQYYSEYFPSFAKHWRNSALCKFAGFLSVLSTSSEVTDEANDTVRCQNQHFILPRNDTVTIQTYKNETCDFMVSSANDQGITVNVLWLSSWSIFDYFVLQESGAECINRSFGWIGFTVAEPCAIVLNCSVVHINVRVSSILEIQESSMIASTNNFEYIKRVDTSNLSAFENSKFQQCENVHIVDGIYQVPYDELPYVRLQELNPSLKITLEGDPYFKPDELPGFDLDLPDAILLAEFPECPNGCFCTLRFQMFFIDCSDVYVSKNILVVSGPPAMIIANSTAIDLSDRQLTHIEPKCFLNLSDVIILLLNQNKMTTIGPGIFEGLDNIHTVDLSSNQISSIEAGSFSHLYKLKRLLLNVNKLKYISHSWLDGLVNVQVLYLGGNTIKEVEADLFSQMQKLNALSLPDCYLAELGNLPNELLLLDIASNTFPSFPTTLPKNLTHLSLDNNDLSILNQTLLHNKSTMVSLVLSHNNLSVIASEVFSHLYTLKHLYLDLNMLELIQIDLFDKLIKLDILDLSNNRIDSLPSGIFKDCHQLKELWLNNNKLGVIQIDLFDELTKLEILSLRSNNIESLQSDVFRDLQQLRELYVNENKLNVIQSDLFNSLTKLETLNLGKNHIESLPSGVFRDLRQLRKLHLYKNKLYMIESDLFNNLTNLEILSLNENNIESLPSEIFINCES
ncbi:uncharacterized protein [Amphiura filiformis]|uniref:uncharacterized protein n=1 Tax=Amphiura filiformis TaxID=82378 RepID=UPI003B20EBE9